MSLWQKARKTLSRGCFVVPVILLNACSSNLVLSSWICKQSVSTGHPDSGSNDAGTDFSQWSTGFENGFCDYSSDGNGSCYTSQGAASYKIVEAPVHAGHYAAAFTVVGDGSNTDTGNQSRCHRDGELPAEAYYKAWYYIPTLAATPGNWNLIHFQGGDGPGPNLDLLWDVSLVNNDTGGLRLTVRSNATLPNSLDLSHAPAIPIATWFHIVFYLKRAADATGAVKLYQDDLTTPIAQQSNLITDKTRYGQWYVGNLATNLEPAESTVYVDDVYVGPELTAP